LDTLIIGFERIILFCMQG